ncbi:MBL fold metallo-hydrolase [Pontibacillus litoralis]|uniref:Metallo-beta-lactamase domain-containing protein n=1 Tax=Pontibacillus litoralis JSM 072002 TaxID=1385512 RepID=A0A0A5G6V6_9BACI|nr:MBL fold metallo-hydrolase [Pontibacillus litoralis]KGX88871.1 hypothetical protein N784_00555 [Pontibacillus litoralis JSM 072002]
MEIEQLPLGTLGTNCYLIMEGEQALIVDPGDEADKLIRMIERRNVKPVAILLTHAHFDHIGAVDAVRNHYQIEVYVHQEEQEWLSNPDLNGSAMFSMVTSTISANKAEHLLQPGKMEISPFHFEVRHTPGHSPGSVSFIFAKEGFAIVGDTLFAGGIGRTDLPGGDTATLITSIEKQLFSLEDRMTIYPGHGPKTTIEIEKQSNPFLT